jgi:fatty-acyl-CoA synthase
VIHFSCSECQRKLLRIRKGNGLIVPSQDDAARPLDLSGQLEVAASPSRGVRVIDPDYETWTSWEQVHFRALQIANKLSIEGVGPGDLVMLPGRTSVDLVAAIRAAWILGAAVLVSPAPGKMRSNSSSLRRLKVLAESTSPKLIIGDSEFLSDMDGWTSSVPRVEFSNVSPSGATGVLDSYVIPDGYNAILQPTSGTTQEPRIVRVPRRCLMANLRAISAALQLDPASDTFSSWLPLSHDMGLAGILASAMVWGIELVVADPSTYAREPSKWMDWCSQYRATITVAPNFAYSLAHRQLAGASNVLDLSCLRATLNGAEPIDVDDFDAYFQSGRRHKLRPSAAMCVYGLAEATLAVSFPALGSGLEIDQPEVANDPNLMSNPITRSHKFALLGSPLAGLELQISSSIASALVDREVGEIEVRGASVTPGYLGEAHERTPNDWLSTGDLGYIYRDQLVVCGRSKEMIIHGGRNIFPEHIEAIVSNVEGVRNGSVVVFGVPGRHRETIVAVIETQSGDHIQTRREVFANVLNDCDVSLGEVVIVDPGALPKTTSGKLARGRARTMFEEGRFSK